MKQKRQYRSYITTIDGKEYAIVRLPLGGGKYKKKVRLLSSLPGSRTMKATQWAMSELEKYERKQSPQSFESLALWYQDEYLVQPVYKDGKKLYGLRTWAAQRRMLQSLINTFGDYDLKDLTVSTLERYKRKELRLVSVTTVNRRFALLKTMMNKAKQRKLVSENPFSVEPGLIQTSLESKRESPLTADTVELLLEKAKSSSSPLLYYVLLVLAHTGARPSEIFPYEDWGDGVLREPLTWDRVLGHDFKAVTLISYKGKVRQKRLVPTSAKLESGLRELYSKQSPTSDADIIFKQASFKRAWATLCKNAGVSGVRMRDFRHYFNTYLVGRQDINDVERMLIMGHTGISTNARYTKIDHSIVEKFRANGTAS